MKLRNYHFFEIKGLNQERLFNNLSQKFEIFEINRLEKNRCTFKVKYFDGPKVKKILLGEGYEILTHKKAGFLNQMAIFCTSYGLIAGIAISVLIYAVQSPYIQKIEVWGVENSAEIAQYVESNLPSKNKNRINVADIEHMINYNFDNISFVSGAIVGQSLVINVKNEIVPPEMESEFAPIVAEYDGVITDISLIQGTLRVQVGDIVQKGQILVEGYVINSSGESFNIQPKATIYMDIWVEGEATHFDEQIVTYRTGAKVTHVSVTLFGAEFYTNGVECTFEQYESERAVQNLSHNNLLPFKVIKTTYYELQSQTIVSTFDEKREQVIEQARENCLQKLQGCEIIKNENYRIIQAAGSTTVKYVITANLLVSGEEDENLHEQT